MTNIKKVKGYMPVPARFKHLDEQRRNVQRALNSIPAGSDELVKVGSTDTTPGFLEDKLTVNPLYLTTSVSAPSGDLDFVISPLVDNIYTGAGAGADTFDTSVDMEGQYVVCRFDTGSAFPKTIRVRNDDIPQGGEITFFIESEGIAGSTVHIVAGALVALRFWSAAGGATEAGPGDPGAQFAGQYTAITIKKARDSGTDTWDVIGNIA